MKEIKFLLFNLITVLLTSSWWVAAVFGHGDCTILWGIPVFLNFIVLIFAFAYLSKHWKD